MRQSRYNLVTPTANAVLLTNLLTRTVVCLTSDEHAFVERLDGNSRLASLNSDKQELITTLLSGRFLVPHDFDEFAFVREMHVAARGDPSVRTVVIAPTMACNMSCHYCFEDKRAGLMGLDTQDQLITFIEQEMDDYRRLHVQWFGGEPLKGLEIVEQLTPRLRECAVRAGAEYSAEIISNGLLLDDATARSLAAHSVSEVQITLEGMRRLHDRVRFTEGHHPTFDQILRNARSASEYLAVNLRIHVAPYNLASVQELLQYLAQKKLQTVFSKVYFSPLFNYRAYDTKQAFAIAPRKFVDSEEFAVQQVALIRQAKDLGFRTGDPLQASYGLCMAMQQGSIVVSPRGLLAKCYLDTDEQESSYARLGEVVGRPEQKSRWDDYDFTKDAECRECTFAPVCLGGCPSQRMQGADKAVVCTPLRYNFHEMIKMYWGHSPSDVLGETRG